MTLATNVGVVNLPFGERLEYGQPYAEGIAVAASNVSDDASAGNHTWSLSADPGFLYRLELFNFSRGEAGQRVVHAITSHRWAAERTPFDSAAFDLNWVLEGYATGNFTVYDLASGGGLGTAATPPREQIRRFPMGTLVGAPGVSVQLMEVTLEGNTNLITNELAVVWTYWNKTSLFQPGFLSAFYEAPEVPPLRR